MGRWLTCRHCSGWSNPMLSFFAGSVYQLRIISGTEA